MTTNKIAFQYSSKQQNDPSQSKRPKADSIMTFDLPEMRYNSAGVEESSIDETETAHPASREEDLAQIAQKGLVSLTRSNWDIIENSDNLDSEDRWSKLTPEKPTNAEMENNKPALQSNASGQSNLRRPQKLAAGTANPRKKTDWDEGLRFNNQGKTQLLRKTRGPPMGRQTKPQMTRSSGSRISTKVSKYGVLPLVPRDVLAASKQKTTPCPVKTLASARTARSAASKAKSKIAEVLHIELGNEEEQDPIESSNQTTGAPLLSRSHSDVERNGSKPNLEVSFQVSMQAKSDSLQEVSKPQPWSDYAPLKPDQGLKIEHEVRHANVPPNSPKDPLTLPDWTHESQKTPILVSPMTEDSAKQNLLSKTMKKLNPVNNYGKVLSTALEFSGMEERSDAKKRIRRTSPRLVSHKVISSREAKTKLTAKGSGSSSTAVSTRALRSSSVNSVAGSSQSLTYERDAPEPQRVSSHQEVCPRAGRELAAPNLDGKQSIELQRGKAMTSSIITSERALQETQSSERAEKPPSCASPLKDEIGYAVEPIQNLDNTSREAKLELARAADKTGPQALQRRMKKAPAPAPPFSRPDRLNSGKLEMETKMINAQIHKPTSLQQFSLPQIDSMSSSQWPDLRERFVTRRHLRINAAGSPIAGGLDDRETSPAKRQQAYSHEQDTHSGSTASLSESDFDLGDMTIERDAPSRIPAAGFNHASGKLAAAPKQAKLLVGSGVRPRKTIKQYHGQERASLKRNLFDEMDQDLDEAILHDRYQTHAKEWHQDSKLASSTVGNRAAKKLRVLKERSGPEYQIIHIVLGGLSHVSREIEGDSSNEVAD